MNLYIDESGSINNHTPNNKYFVIALIYPTDKDRLKRTYKRFVSSNHDNLLALGTVNKLLFTIWHNSIIPLA